SAPGVAVLDRFGDAEHAKNSPISGGRLSLGYWNLVSNPWIPGGVRDFGAEAVIFVVGQKSVSLRNDFSPNLIRPFFGLNSRREFGSIVAAPGLSSGNLTAHADANLWGTEANLWKAIYLNYPGTSSTVSLMAGLRYLSADEQVRIGSTSLYNP